MNIVVHPPVGEENVLSLKKRVAEVHANAVARYLAKLDCPKEQKIQLLQKIKEEVR